MSLLPALLLAAVSVWPQQLGSYGEPLRPRRQTALTFPDGKTIQVDVVDTPLERERGLMFRRKLPKDYGMLFVFPREQPMTFWMKNTWVSLDIVFIAADKSVTRLHKKVRASTEKTSDQNVARVGGLALYVLELPSGAAARHGLKEGQALAFEAAIPQR